MMMRLVETVAVRGRRAVCAQPKRRLGGALSLCPLLLSHPQANLFFLHCLLPLHMSPPCHIHRSSLLPSFHFSFIDRSASTLYSPYRVPPTLSPDPRIHSFRALIIERGM